MNWVSKIDGGFVLKFIVFFFAFAFVTTLNNQNAFAYPKPVAVITNYDHDNLAGQINILRANGKPSGAEELLYPNDQITGNYQKVQIKFAPYANYHSSGNSYVIDYNPPSFLERTKDTIVNLYNDFMRSVEQVTRNVSRGAPNEKKLMPQPGFDVTLLSGQKVNFSWYAPNNKTLSITNDKGKKIFQKDINGLTSIEIDINELKLQAGKQYFWSVDNSLQNCKITMLDKESEKEILSTLAAIDSENISENERLFKKITYVQFISDTYPERFDLYWLSAQWLFDIKPTTKDEKFYQEFLLDKCLSNLTGKLSKK